MSGGTLIVGASQAGLQLAVSLRENGYDGPVTLVGAENNPPYQRPALSKKFLAGQDNITSLSLRTPAFYAGQRINLVCGERIVTVTARPSGSGVATTASGRAFAFDQLALTVGARPRRLSVPGSNLDGVCYLRHADDALVLRQRLDRAKEVVVVGGGFIGLEAAAVFRSAGRRVTVVEAAERLIARAVAPVTSEFYRQAHERRGTQIRLGTGVAAIDGAEGRVCGVQLTDGSCLRADLVLVGIGVEPRLELAEQLGLHCKGGVVVDGFARTSNPRVVAAGDCTVFARPSPTRELMRLESVQNAVDQARTAGATLAGVAFPHTAVPWFWSDQDTLKLQIAGLSAGHDAIVVRGDCKAERFSVLYYRSERLIAADCVNRAADYIAVRRALAQELTIPKSLAGDESIPLKNLASAES
ncbi:NAD(P)/FAD-dependent oxidoreductase [Streptomyces bobili]|uniref:NAD(P)/FAD-dependent oxidoreductase n=1 Tax=Streptomyces bobili TaxID=67280 RepID=UPI00382F1D4C